MKKILNVNYKISIIVLVIYLMNGCKKDDNIKELPRFSNVDVIEITDSEATFEIEVASEGSMPILAKGICWATVSNPTTLDDKTNDGDGSANYSSKISGLTPNTTYFLRAYAVNNIGTGYSESITFTTKKYPDVITEEITEITDTTALTGGKIVSEGSSAIIAKGVCWSNEDSPTILDYISEEGSGSENYISKLINLAPNTQYYVRAYAKNNEGIGYGNIISFTTENTPIISTKDITNITSTTAESGGIISNDGSSSIISKGVCWSENTEPTVSDNKTNEGTGTAGFSSNLTGLKPNTIYYLRAYAQNSTHVRYGEIKTFTTLPEQEPTVTTSEVYELSYAYAIIKGSIISNGGLPLIGYGICYSNSPNPTISSEVSLSNTASSEFSSDLTGLNEETTYYYRAYAINSIGVGYGEQKSFTTDKYFTIKDVEDNMYNTVTIGIKIWMKENLKTTKYNDGTDITYIIDNTTWQNNTTGAYTWYNNDEATYKPVYGALYNWYAISTDKLCPSGWHVPSDDEWATLKNYLISNGYNFDGSTEYNKIAKAMSSINNWNSTTSIGAPGNTDYPGYRNKSGFSAIPSGRRLYHGAYEYIGEDAIWWSSTEYLSNAILYDIYYTGQSLDRTDIYKNYGLSVRCIKD
jgi:uncharacterized protein (TIGR02145 family)